MNFVTLLRLRPLLRRCAALSLGAALLLYSGSLQQSPADASELLQLGTCADPLPIACGWTVRGDTTGGANHISTYCGLPRDETGPEHIYEFTLPAGTRYDVTARLIKPSANLDVDSAQQLRQRRLPDHGHDW